jgi:hypothetical protein
MSTKPNRLVLIEPDSSRWELIRSVLANSSSGLGFEVVSNLSEAQPHVNGTPHPMVFSALSPVADPAEDDSKLEISSFSHAMRGSLGIILNATFLLKRIKPDDVAQRENYLAMIEEEVKNMNKTLSDLQKGQ